jgi:hypothetical protein
MMAAMPAFVPIGTIHPMVYPATGGPSLAVWRRRVPR